MTHYSLLTRLTGHCLALTLALSAFVAPAQTAATRPLVRLDFANIVPPLPINPGNTDATYIYFQNGATSGFDSYDSDKLSNSNGLNISSYISTPAIRQLVFNGLPPYTPGAPVLVPLFFGVPSFGRYVLTAAEFQNFVDTRVVLHDYLLNTLTELSLNSTYAFDVTSANTSNTYRSFSRFVLEFYPLSDLVVTTTMTPPLPFYRNVLITPTGVLQLDKNLNVGGNATPGTLTIQNGGVLDTGSGGTTATDGFVLTGDAFVMNPNSSLIVVSHDGIASSGATGNIRTTSRSYSSGGRYTYSPHTAASTTAVTGTGLPTTVRYLGVAGSIVTGTTLSPGTLRLTRPLTLTQQLDLITNLNTNGQSLTLRSTPTRGTAIVGRIDGTLTGTLTAERAIDPTLNAGSGYRHFSNPLNSGPTFGIATTGNFVPVVNPAYNASLRPNLLVPFPNLFTYDFTRIPFFPTPSYSPFDRGWKALAPGDAAPVRGTGFIAHIEASNKVLFSGTLNEANQTVAVPANPSALPGYLLLGNPFAAPIDGRLLTRPASVPAAFHVFQTTGLYMGTYRSFVNNVGLVSPLIPLGQGFFMSQDAGGTTGSIGIPTSARQATYDSATVTLHRSADVRPQVQLALSGAGHADLVHVYAEPGATLGYDGSFDARKLPSAGQVELAALAGGEALSIAGIPALNPAQVTTVPLRAILPQAGTYAFEATALLNLTGAPVYLLDAVAGRATDLQQQPRYLFTVTAGAVLAGRFALQFGAARPTATANAALAAALLLYPNPAHGTVTVSVPPVAGATQVTATVLDNLGRAVAQQQQPVTPAGTVLTLPIVALAPGVYTVRLLVAGQVLTRKLVVE